MTASARALAAIIGHASAITYTPDRIDREHAQEIVKLAEALLDEMRTQEEAAADKHVTEQLCAAKAAGHARGIHG